MSGPERPRPSSPDDVLGIVGHPRPPSLDDVMGIVERRRHRRARIRKAAAPALSAAAVVGVAGFVVAAVQAGSDVSPAAPGVSALPAPSATPTPTDPPPSVDPGYLVPNYLGGLLSSLTAADGETEHSRRYDDAVEMERSWDVPAWPAAKVVLAKAEVTGVEVDPTDPGGDDVLVERFAAAGYSAADAAELAEAWETDPRTAQVVGGLLMGTDPAGG